MTGAPAAPAAIAGAPAITPPPPPPPIIIIIIIIIMVGSLWLRFAASWLSELVIADSAAVIWSLLVAPPDTRDSASRSMVGNESVGMTVLGGVVKGRLPVQQPTCQAPFRP